MEAQKVIFFREMIDAASIFASRGETSKALRAQAIAISGNLGHAIVMSINNLHHPAAFRLKNAINAMA